MNTRKAVKEFYQHLEVRTLALICSTIIIFGIISPFVSVFSYVNVIKAIFHVIYAVLWIATIFVTYYEFKNLPQANNDNN